MVIWLILLACHTMAWIDIIFLRFNESKTDISKIDSDKLTLYTHSFYFVVCTIRLLDIEILL